MVNQIQNNNIVLKQNKTDFSAPIPTNWAPGDILEGTVINNKPNKTTIEIQGIKIDIKPNDSIGNVGSTIRFIVETKSKDEIVLKLYEEEAKKEKDKEVRSVKQYDKVQSILRKESISISDQNIEIAKSMLDNGMAIEKEMFDNVVSAKKQIEKIINTMTKKEAKDLLDSPYDVEKISLDVITRFLSNNSNSNKTVSKDEIEEQLNKYIKDEETTIKKSVTALLQNDLPVTRRNIDSLVFVQEKLEAVKNMDDEAISQVVKKDFSHTLNNLYASIFSSGEEGIANQVITPYEDAGLIDTANHKFSDEEIKTLLRGQQISTDDEHIMGARFLIEHNIEVDQEKVENVILLKKEIENVDEASLLDRAAQLLKENKNPGNVGLANESAYIEKPLSDEEIKELMNDIKNIDEETIKRILRRNLPINLKNLKEELNKENKDVVVDNNIDKEQNFITAKRQLEEVRLKMTLEAARKLNQKIEIDTVPLKELVDGLKNLEKEYYGDCLKKAGAEPSDENVQKLEELYEKLDVVKKLDEGVLPKVIRKELSFIIDDLYKEQISNEVSGAFKVEAAASRYEEMETKPDPRFGDAIRKIEDQIEPLLKEQGIETTKENIRSARILIQNNIEVTEENIANLKLLDQKVTYVGTNLHPAIAAEMIKEGFRPDLIPIDKVINYIKSFESILGNDVRDKLNEFILQLDEQKALTKEEREGMIGIYRTLHTIEQSNGKVIGWLMKNNMSFTLSNLMEGAKYLSRTGGNKQDMNVAISDEFGVVEERTFHEKSIKTQLEKAFSENTSQALKPEQIKAEYLSNILEDFIKEAVPHKLRQWINGNPNILEEDLETIYREYIKEGAKNDTASSNTDDHIKDFLKELGNLKKVNQETLVFMERNQIPTTIRNLQIVSSIIENPFRFGENLEKFNSILKELNLDEDIHEVVKKGIRELKNEKDVEEVLDRVKEKVKEVKHELLDSSSGQKQNGWKLGTDIEKMIDIQKQVQKQDSTYQIPILLNGKVSNMNVYFRKDRDNSNQKQKDGISAFISIETENMGHIQMYIQMNEKNVEFKMSGETKEITNYLKTQEDSLKNAIENIGYKIVKGQIQEELEELKETSEQSPLLTPMKKHEDSDFEMII